MRTWIQQPARKKVCGQVAVAVITGISLEESIKLIGKKGCTRTKDLVKALKAKGFECSNRCKKMNRPNLGIAQAHTPNKSGWHWVVVDKDKIWDGHWGTPDGKVNWPKEYRITSYLEIYDRNNR